mgnify:CR=1 FL=1
MPQADVGSLANFAVVDPAGDRPVPAVVANATVHRGDFARRLEGLEVLNCVEFDVGELIMFVFIFAVLHLGVFRPHYNLIHLGFLQVNIGKVFFQENLITSHFPHGVVVLVLIAPQPEINLLVQLLLQRTLVETPIVQTFQQILASSLALCYVSNVI